MSADDRERAEAYEGAQRQVAAGTARLLLRTVAGHVLGVPASRVRLTGAPGTRTVVDHPGVVASAFSVSHDRTGVAVAYHRAGCGVDVEDLPEAEFREIAGRYCTPEELRAARETPAPADMPSGGRARADVPRGLRELWTVKESVAKALGGGLAVGLRALTCSSRMISGPLTGAGTGLVTGPSWAAALCRGAPTGHLVWAAESPGRHLAVAVRATSPPRVRISQWEGSGDRLTERGPPVVVPDRETPAVDRRNPKDRRDQTPSPLPETPKIAETAETAERLVNAG
ncbi:4'-phosphopantetheinyl transferase family protein [Streptomyces monticola]|uniref:4'-phosphopantetheinyl transferase family protein n=1 Tax=Streptomyces monticola TaxID=2666263 RepID=A0ABW2JEU5_9ACTN